MPRSVAIGIVIGVGCSLAAAQQPPPESMPDPEPAPPARSVTASIHVRGEMGFETEFSGSPGKLTVRQAGGGVDVGIPIAQYSQLSVGFDYEHSSYDFKDATAFVAGTSSPFGDVNRETLSARFSQFLSQEWSYFVGGSVSLSGEEGAETGESVQGVIYAAPRYAFSETFSVAIGVLVATKLEDNALVLPLATINWDFAERWNLSNNGKLGLAVTYKPDDAWALSVGASYDSRDFRLDRNGPVPGGVGRDTRVPVAFTAAYTPTPRINLEATIGAHLAQNIEILNASGDSIADVDADPSMFLALRLGFSF